MDAITEIEEMNSRIRSCVLCPLSKHRTKAVPGEGKIAAPDVLFIGEAPGRNEDFAGRPFVGAGGKLLDALLREAHLNRDETYVTNIVKCRPPNNRRPDKRIEIPVCTSHYLERQIELIQPKLICSLGATALEFFVSDKVVMSTMHGKLIATKDGRPLYPTYHPASVFRNRALRKLLAADLEKIPAIVKGIDNARKQVVH